MRWVIVSLSVAGLVLSTGCEQDEPAKPKSETTAEPSAAATAAVLNPEIAEAVAKAASDNADEKATGSDKGPPPNGILSKERADEEATVARGAKVVLGSRGDHPRFQLGGPEPTNAIGQMELSVRLGPRTGLPTTSFRFQVSSKPNSDQAGAPAIVQFDVAETVLAKNQPGQIPPQLAEEVRKLRGSQYRVTTRGGKPATSPEFELAKTASSKLNTLLAAGADTLSSVVLAFPDEPIGKNGLWLITTRETFLQTDVVSYRVVKVLEASKERIRLDVQTKRYAAADRLGLPGVGAHQLVEFKVNETADMVVVPGQRLPLEARVESTVTALLESSEGNAPMQQQTRALFAFPAKAE